MEGSKSFGERLALARQESKNSPAVHRHSVKLNQKTRTECISMKNSKSSKNSTVKTIKKPKRQASSSGRIKKSGKSPSKVSRESWRRGRNKSTYQYDFSNALRNRNLDIKCIPEEVRKNAEILFEEHKWIKPYVALNVLLDVSTMSEAREVLRTAEHEDRNIFGRGSVGRCARVLTDSEKKLVAKQKARNRAENVRIKDEIELTNYLTEEELEKTRKILISTLNRWNKLNSENNLKESSKLEVKLGKLRSKLVHDTLHSKSFREAGTIDLHGLSVKSSLECVVRALQVSNFQKEITVIHGKGKHSELGVSCVAFNIARFLADAKIDFEPDESNKGRLRIRPDVLVPLDELLRTFKQSK